MDSQPGNPTAHYGSVSFLSSQGFQIESPLTHLTRHLAVFTLHNADQLLRSSEVLPEFKLRLQDQIAFSGRAIVQNAVLTGTQLVVEATLDEGWLETKPLSTEPTALHVAFLGFVQHWQKLYRVNPDFKVLVADLQTFLIDLRLWLEQIELGIRT